jgi:hypothetical protein
MADSYSAILRFRLQQTGANNNTWGALLNSAAIQLIEDSIAGRSVITVTTLDITLSTANGASDQARMAAIELQGSPGTAKNIICPSASKFYLVINNTDAAMTLKTSAGTGIAVAVGVAQYLFCDGTNVISVSTASTGTVATATNALNLGGVPAASYARLDVTNVFTGGLVNTFVALTDAATTVMDVDTGKNFRWPIGGDRTLQIDNAVDGSEFELWIVQDSTGGRLVTWPGTVIFEGGSTPVLSVLGNSIDRFQGTYNAALSKWVVRAGLNSAAGSATVINVTGGGMNLSLWDLAGRPAGVVSLAVTIAMGTVIGSLSTRAPALDLTGFASGSTLTITNYGYILGRGGRGGTGGVGADSDTTIYTAPGAPGVDGGQAILGPGTGITCTIFNASGYIWGGGGGGGGGGTNPTNNDQCAGGGGGGGAPYGDGCDGGGAGQENITGRGGKGLEGTKTTGGTGGAAYSQGLAVGGAGGAGGTPGVAGSAGASPTGGGHEAPGGTFGAAGKAIEFNGGTVTVSTGSGAPNVLGAVS